MVDIQLIRENPEMVKEAVAKKKCDPKLVDKLFRIDEEWRAKTVALDQLKADQNLVNKELARGQTEELLSKAQILKKRVSELEEEYTKLEHKRKELFEKIPNVPFVNVPVGKDETENKILREVGKKPEFDFTPKEYFSLGEELGLINTKKAGEITGSRFGYLMREAALMEFALVRLAYDVALPHGFIPVIPPVMIRGEVYEEMGRLAGDQKEERYHLGKDDLYLIGSAEHTMGPLHRGEVLEKESLPRRYIGFSTCFRREAGTYGKDTKGILRVHQFDKVEFFSFTTPEKSEEEHQFLLSLQEELMQKLELPYRVVEVCTGDMGWTDARQYDIEAWFPAEGKYRETHSCSNTTDFQARGVNTKYKTEKGKKELVHMLNATAFSQRPILAIIENNQTKDGTVKIPKALQEFVGKKEIQGIQ